MSPASFSGRFLLIIFLQLLRSTTTSPSPSPTSVPTSVKEDTANLPLIVFQHHHHSHRNLGDFPTTQLPLTSQEDYYAYNVMSAGGGEGVEEERGGEEEMGGGVRKHHQKLDDSKVDEVVRKHHYKLDDLNVDEVVDTVARKHHYKLVDPDVDEVVRKHHYKLDDPNVDEVVRKHHYKLDDSKVDELVRKHQYKQDELNVDELVDTVARKHHYKLDDPNVDELVAFRGKKHHGEATGKSPMRTLYQVGDSDSSLPVCGRWAVCGKIDIYDPGHPWLEKQCRCPEGDKSAKGASSECSTLQTAHDGHTVVDKTRHYKVCEPVHKLPRCRYFRDVTWTLRTEAGNGTQQTMHCLCPRGSVAYLIKRLPYQTSNNAIGYQYSFACSPQSRLRCQRKEPCRLFTVRRRLELLDEVNTNTLCQCPRDHTCPTHHTHTAGVVQGKTYLEENVRTYSGYCLPNN